MCDSSVFSVLSSCFRTVHLHPIRGNTDRNSFDNPSGIFHVTSLRLCDTYFLNLLHLLVLVTTSLLINRLRHFIDSGRNDWLLTGVFSYRREVDSHTSYLISLHQELSLNRMYNYQSLRFYF